MPHWGRCVLLCAGLLPIRPCSAQEMRGTPQLVALEEAEPSPIAESAENSAAPPLGTPDATPSTPSGETQGLENIHASSGQAFGEKPVGIPYSSIFRSTGGRVGGVALPTNIKAGARTDEGRGDFSVGLPQFRGGWPTLNTGGLERGFSPADAHLKMGPVYVRFGYLSGALLASDNINQTQSNRESGSIAAVRLGMTVVTQLSEGLRFALAGTINYLPFTGEVGVGLGNENPYGALLYGLAYEPLLASQLSYETDIAGWPVIFSDDTRVDQAEFYNQNTPRDNFRLFSKNDREYEDRAGRYVFTAPTTRFGARDSNGNNSENKDRNNVTYLSNMVSAATSRLLPSDLAASARAFHENLWYYNDTGRGLPSDRDLISMELASRRENLRFKPFVGYEAVKTNLMSTFDQSLYTGIRGPITNQLTFYGKVALFYGDAGEDTVHWRLQLNHIAGPYTLESLTYAREMDDFHDATVNSLEYRLQQILGPDIRGTLFTSLIRYENRFDSHTSQDEFRTGALLTYDFSPKTEMSIGGTFAKINPDSSQMAATRTWTGRYAITYHATDTLTTQLLYQYQKYDSSLANDSYYENLIRIMLTKTFY